MNYYKQGSEEKASQIKAAFERLGYTTCGFNFKSDKGVYYTDRILKNVDFVSNPAFVELIKTHPDYKELELPVEPIFKVGDKIRSKLTQITYTINEIDVVNGRYKLDYCSVLDFKAQDKFELVSKPNPHYDIENFNPFDKVLVRDTENEKWAASLFSNLENCAFPHKFVCIDTCYTQCIPFDGNEHLLGTTDMCDEMYINW